MRRLAVRVIFVSLILTAQSATRADGLLHKLPADGAWAKFDLEKCAGIAAQFVITRGNFDSVFTCESRLHDRAPFGVVKFRSSSIHKEKGEVKIPIHVTDLRLADFGADAKSALPERN
ncbi:MAG: hypothetical protein HY290_28310 [Planctomycetia bacterium]|nr:hypothetical protein [Planctomycetia bacterium]